MKARSTLAVAALALAGCASTVYNLSNPSLMLAGTPGEYFRQYLKLADADCRERQLGPYLPADEPPRSPRRAISDCRFITLKPWQPGDSPESAYAHSLKLPPPHDKPVDVYKPGMRPEEYFEALCKAQAGEFIFRRVEGVEGIVELRPRAPESSEMNRHLTAFEDPATGGVWAIDTGELLVEQGLRFAERSGSRSLRAQRWSRNPSSGKIESRFVEGTSSNFGYTWRGIWDPRQLELGIAGGELLVVELSTNQVLAVKRDFALRYLGRYGSEQQISATGFEQGNRCGSLNVRRDNSARWEPLRFIQAVTRIRAN